MAPHHNAKPNHSSQLIILPRTEAPMVHHPHPPEPPNQRPGIDRNIIRIVMYVSIAIIVFFLVTEHAAHLAGLLPYSFLLVCILMHLFMHGMHGGHGGHGGSNDGNQSR